ncbi:MAG: hypothetical protein CL930_13915 [Deltaproteobacteria bacterium]|nr:hypothetical protein [Deltaproteobacteria bacterium]
MCFFFQSFFLFENVPQKFQKMGVVLESESSESEGDLPKKVEKEEEEEEVRRVSETPRVGSFVFLFSLFFREAQTSF